MSKSELQLHRERQERARRFRQPRRMIRDAGAPASVEEDLVPDSAGQDAAAEAAAAAAAEIERQKAAERAQRVTRRKKVTRTLVKSLLLTVEILLLGTAVYGLVQLHRQTKPVSFEIRYLVPDQADIVETVSAGGSAVLHDPVELDGYTFLYWERPDGAPETEADVAPAQNTVYTAR